MLELSFSRIQLSMELPLSVNSAALDEGTPLEFCASPAGTGLENVQAGASTANAVHAGAALSVFTRPSTFVQVDTLVVPTSSPYTVTLSYTPVAATNVSAVTGGAALTYTTGAPTTGQFAVSGTTATFNSAQAGATIVLTYRYNITVQQAEILVGDGIAGGYSPSAVTGTIGVIQRGIIYTSDFDTSKYWGSGTVSTITVGTGIYTLAGAGAAVTGTVVATPTGDVPFLGLYIRA